MHQDLPPNLFYNGCHFWRHTIVSCSFLAGYPAASATSTEHIVSCSSAAGLPTPSTFQPWHNLQLKAGSICSTHGKRTKNEPYSSCSGRGIEGLFPADFWLPPPGPFWDVFRSRPSSRYWSCAVCHHFLWSCQCGTHPFLGFSKPAISRATWHVRVNASHIWRWEIKKPYAENSEFGEQESEGPFT